MVPAPAKNVALRAGQYRVFSDPERALGLARAVVAAKIANQRTLLMRSLRSQPREPGGDGDRAGCRSPRAPTVRGSDEPAAREMAELLARVPTAPDLGVLLGLEGQAAALYFANFGRMLKARSPGAAFDFTDAEPPPAPRPGELRS